MVDDGDVDAYLRLSKNRDGRKESCNRQLREIQTAAEAVGDVIDREEQVGRDDNLSAWRRDVHRPAWEERLQRIRDGKVRKLWIWRFDRMMRQPRDLEELIDIGEPRGLIIASTIGPPRNLGNYSDRHYLRGEIAHAARYSDEVSDKAQVAHRHMAAEGRPHAGGRRPFGYRQVRGRLIPDPDDPGEMMPAPATLEVIPEEAEVVRQVFAWFIAGESIYSIAPRLRAAGVSTVTGIPWGTRSVRSLLRSPVVAGLRKHRGLIVADGLWEPIIPKDQWYEVQRIMDSRAQPANNAKNEYLLNRLVVCGQEGCGAFLRPLSGGRSRRPTYVCSPLPEYGGCGHLSVDVENADRYVARIVARVIDDPKAARPGAAQADVVARAQAAADAARAKLEEIAEDYGEERITRAERDTSRVKPAERLAAAEKVLAERQPQPHLIMRGRPWKELPSFAAQRAALRSYVRQVVVAPRGKRAPWDDKRIFIDWW